MDEHENLKYFCASIYKSKQLSELKTKILNNRGIVFNIHDAAIKICEKKNIISISENSTENTPLSNILHSRNRIGIENNSSHDQTSIKYTPEVENMITKLNYINIYNRVIHYILALVHLKFDIVNKNHVSLLENFWDNMLPGVHREKYVRKIPSLDVTEAQILSTDWNKIGFQGKDPRTDFRAMGIYGLMNLVYMSKIYDLKSRQILFESNHPRRFFPFAATGINISNFIITVMLPENRLYGCLLDVIVQYMLKEDPFEKNVAYGTHDSNNCQGCFDAEGDPFLAKNTIPGNYDTNANIIDYTTGIAIATTKKNDIHGLNSFVEVEVMEKEVVSPASRRPRSAGIDVEPPIVLIHACHQRVYELYVEIYSLFITDWVAADPENIMAFSKIFGVVKEKILQKYPPYM